MSQTVLNSRLALALLFAAGPVGRATVQGQHGPPPIRVVMDNNYPPFAFMDSDGVLRGISVDQWRLWERKTGRKVEFHALNWDEAQQRMRAGEFDVIDAIFKTDERSNYLVFSKSYRMVNVSIFFDREITGITDAKSLRGFPVGVEDGDADIDFLQKNGVETLLRFPNCEGILQAAWARKLTVFVAEDPLALYYLHKFGLQDRFRHSAPLFVGEFHRAVAKRNPALLQEVENGFAQITPRELQAIENVWYGTENFGQMSLRWIPPAAIATGLFMLFLFAWNRSLRSRVRLRTAELKASQELFQSIYNAVNDAIFIHNVETGEVVDVNDQMCAMYRCTREQALAPTAEHFSLGVPPYDGKTAVVWLRKAAAGEPQIFPWHCRRADRSLFWGEVNMRRARIGSVDRIVVTVRDITEGLKTQEALQTGEKQIRHILASANCLLWQARVTQRAAGGFDWDLYIPPSSLYRQLFGVDPDDTPRFDWEELGVPEVAAMQAKCCRAILSGEPRYAQEFHAVVGGRVTWLHEQVSISKETECAWILVGVLTDITERKALEDQMLRAQRLESVGRLVGGIAHDLNNILAPVIFGTQMLRDAVNSAEATRTLATMESSAKRGAAIVSQLLSFSRGGVKGHEPVQLNLIVRDMCAIMRETFPKNISARAVHPPEVWTVLGNPTQFHQILMNLCVNACDAMPAGGTLSIELENVQLDGAFAAKVPGVTPGPHVLLSVTDTGVGIAPEVVGKIFDPFFTTKDVGEGTGLGLSTVLGIATSHGGVVQVTSQIGVGTQFRVYLPAVPKSVAPADPDAVAVPSGAGETILFVEDEVAVRGMARRILEKRNYQVVEAADGREALACYAEHDQTIAVVITDLLMPVLDGPSFIRELRRINPSVPVIVTSGNMEGVSFPPEEKARVQAFLTKPYTADELLILLNHTLHLVSA